MPITELEYSGNYFLSDAEMTTNALLIYKQLTALGWSINAIAAMLGNMESESTINPGIWEDLRENNTVGGYGLVQWTPASKYLDWCTANNLTPSKISSAIARIEYELANGLQWIQTDSYPLSFAEFKTGKQSTVYLANAFLHNYERPANLNQPNRAAQAQEWYKIISGVDPDTPVTPEEPKNKKLPLWLIIAAARRF